MLSQSALTTARDLPVYEDSTQGGTLRTSNLKNQYQRPIITSRGQQSTTYKATCTLKTCVHGYLDSSATTPIPASLIVLEYSLNALKKNKYNTAYTEFQFSAGVGKNALGGGSSPQVVAWAPHTGKANVTTAEESKTKDLKFESLSVEVLGTGGEIAAPMGSTSSTTGTHTYFQLVQSDKSMSQDAGIGADTVWWNMEQNQREKDGVPPTITTAILLQRADQEKFTGRFVLNLEAEKKHAARESWNRFWGVVEDDPVLFDPALPKYGGEGIVEGHLDCYRVNNDLERMGHFENPPVVD